METGYKWSVNITTWNHLQLMWQGSFLDLLRQVYEETQHQDCIECLRLQVTDVANSFSITIN
jgi:hypothetical protein